MSWLLPSPDDFLPNNVCCSSDRLRLRHFEAPLEKGCNVEPSGVFQVLEGFVRFVPMGHATWKLRVPGQIAQPTIGGGVRHHLDSVWQTHEGFQIGHRYLSFSLLRASLAP